MARLLEILGLNVTSPEAKAELAKYPGLEHDVDEVAADEGMPPVHYMRSEEDGLLIKLSDDGEIVTIFMMSEGKDGFAQFRGELPGQLSFASTASDTLKKLGAPAYSKPPGRVGSYEHGESLRFDRAGYSVHFQFRKGGGIELITAAVAGAVPGRSVS